MACADAGAASFTRSFAQDVLVVSIAVPHKIVAAVLSGLERDEGYGDRQLAAAFHQDLEAQRVLVLEQFAQLARSHSYLLRLGIRRGDGALRGGEAHRTHGKLFESRATARRRQRIMSAALVMQSAKESCMVQMDGKS